MNEKLIREKCNNILKMFENINRELCETLHLKLENIGTLPGILFKIDKFNREIESNACAIQAIVNIKEDKS